MIEYVILFIIVVILGIAAFCYSKDLDSWDKIKAYVSGTTVTTTTDKATTATTATATGTTQTTAVTTTTATETKTTTTSTNPSIGGTTTTVIEPHPTVNNPTPTTIVVGQSSSTTTTSSPPSTSSQLIAPQPVYSSSQPILIQPSYPAPQPVLPPAPQPVVNTFYMINPGGGYVNGKTFNEASAACLANGDRMATLSELQRARDRGFGMCANGWTSDQKAAFAMQETNKPGCITGSNGLSINTYPLTNKYGTYCMTKKTIPSGITLYQAI